MCGVAGEEDSPGGALGADEAAHGQDAFGDQRALVERCAVDGHPGVEFGPDPVVGPVLDVIGGVDLELEPTDGGRSHTAHRKAVGVPGVDQFIGGRAPSQQRPLQKASPEPKSTNPSNKSTTPCADRNTPTSI